MSENQPIPRTFNREAAAAKIMERPELADLNRWYKERLASLAEMRTENAPLTDGKNWKANMAENGEVDEIDGSFFTLKGQRVTLHSPDGSILREWTQPGTLQKEGKVVVETSEGAMEVKASGLVGAIKDTQGNILITLGHEPYAKDAPKRILARTPVQTSAAKLAAVLSGDTTKDAAMYEFMSTVTGSDDVSGFFSNNAGDLFSLPYADANRIEANNIGFTTIIPDGEMHEAVTKGGQNRWCTQREAQALAKAGILNGHTASAAYATQFD